jgi:SAM-dependent methyltransferase
MKPEAYRIMDECEQSYWWYRVRREIIADTVERFVPRGGRLLDFGCGHGATAERLAQRGYDVRVTDRADSARAACRARGLAVVEPDELAAWGEEGFDCVLACDVLEHVENDAALLSRLRALSHPEGLVLVTVPAYEFLWSGEDYVSEHVRRYTRRRLVRVLRAAGLEPLWQSHFNALLFAPVAAAIIGTRLFRPRALYQSNIQPLPPPLDSLLGRIFALERPCLKRLRFPFGTSLIVVARGAGRTSATPRASAAGAVR